MKNTAYARLFRNSANGWTIGGLLIGVGFFLISAFAAYSNVNDMRANEARIRNTHEVLSTLDELLAASLDAETGQRGYLLTGEGVFPRIWGKTFEGPVGPGGSPHYSGTVSSSWP